MSVVKNVISVLWLSIGFCIFIGFGVYKSGLDQTVVSIILICRIMFEYYMKIIDMAYFR
jgi:hypothetical protein